MSGAEDAESALSNLSHQVASGFPDPGELILIGIANGGIPLARHLFARLQPSEPMGVINPLFHRDDLGRKPIPKQFHPTSLPFEIEGREILLVDDVFASGRTLRAVLNELFDHGRPDRVRFATPLDTLQHKLPYRPDFIGASVNLPADLLLHVEFEENDPVHCTAKRIPA